MDPNAKKALRQLKMEFANEYEIDNEYIFDAIENASNGGILKHFMGHLDHSDNDVNTDNRLE